MTPPSKEAPRGFDAHFHTRLVDNHGKMNPSRIVLHSTESDGDGWTYGDAIANFWKRQGQGYGAHFVVSRDGAVTDCLPRTFVAWHVQNHNTGSIGIEQAGYARFTRAEWMRRPLELDATARLIARLCHNWDIPAVDSTESGVCTHADCSARYGGSHTDPGALYPFTHVLGMARAYLKAGGWVGEWNATGR